MKLFKFLKRLLSGRDEDYEYDFETEEASIDQVLRRETLKRASLDVDDYREREKYVRACCEQMVQASADEELAKRDYNDVTAHLTDMEEIEALPEPERRAVDAAAKKVTQIEQEDANYKRPMTKITDAQYRQIEAIEDDVEAVIVKMKEQEDYQMTVKKDLQLLEGEKSSYIYQAKSARTAKLNARSWAFISMFAVSLAILLLAILQYSMYIYFEEGYFIAAGIAAILLTAAFVKFKNAQSAQRAAERKANRVISLQNHIKIKYVNVTNVLDYYYTKYKVNNSYELSYMWEKYLEEKAVREHSEQIMARLDETGRELCSLLKKYRVKDPYIWVHQAEALLNPKEMVEIRHALIIQRQKLRKRIDFDTFHMQNAKDEIEDLVKRYPKYAKEILAIVTEYDS
ncbi:MAG: hypothetical protein GX567_14025 [Clostridia bacterium]|nr:hypothetical protein [Clostridia bacterium]